MPRPTIALTILLAACGGVAALPAEPTDTTGTTSTTTGTTLPLPDLTVADDRRQVITVRNGGVRAAVPGIVGMGGAVILDGDIGGVVSDGDLVPLVTDRHDEWVALGPRPAAPAEGTIAPGCTSTEIVIVSPDGDLVGRELDGNLVPEAFSLEPEDGTAPWLYVLEYLPPEAPTHYRVRLLDPSTGTLSWPLSVRRYGETVDTQMAGISRDQVVAGRSALLFTLYRGHHADEGRDYAFIHVLSMWGGVWCLDVPAELELAGRPGVVAVSPDESTLYAVSSNGFVAEYVIDDVLDPNRTPAAWRTVSTSGGGEDRPAAVATGEHLVIAHGRRIDWLELGELSVVGTATAPDVVDALAAGRDGTVLVAANGSLAVAAMDGTVAVAATLPPEVGRATKIFPG